MLEWIKAKLNIGSVVRPCPDLKCCGNCYYRDTRDNDDHHVEYCQLNENNPSWQICKKWKYDKMTINQRYTGIELL